MLCTVEIHLREADLMTVMSQMRVWLDGHGYEPDLFQYQAQRNGALCRVDFKVATEAMQFAEAFGGSVLREDQLTD
jgi:hypothetical protein